MTNRTWYTQILIFLQVFKHHYILTLVQDGKCLFMSLMRAKTAIQCPIRAIGESFFARFTVQGEPFPDPTNAKSWCVRVYFGCIGLHCSLLVLPALVFFGSFLVFGLGLASYTTMHHAGKLVPSFHQQLSLTSLRTMTPYAGT